MGIFGDIAYKINTYLSTRPHDDNLKLVRSPLSPILNADKSDRYGANPWTNRIGDMLQIEQDLISRYRDYDEMMKLGDTEIAISVYADDTTQTDPQKGHILWVNCKNEEIKLILENFLYKTINIDNILGNMVRTLCIYGNAYWEILADDNGLSGIHQLKTKKMRRIEGIAGDLKGFIYSIDSNNSPNKGLFIQKDFLFNKNQKGEENIFTFADQYNKSNQNNYNSNNMTVAYNPNEVIHFRLPSDETGDTYLYGRSVLDPARWMYKRIVILDDAAFTYRVQRAPERFAFYVPVPLGQEQERARQLNEFKQTIKKKQFINSTNGSISLRFESLAPNDDFFIPVDPEGKGPRVQQMSSPSWQSMADLEYFLRRFYIALKVPQSLMTQDGGTGKTSLSQADMRFGRTIQAIQNCVIQGIKELCDRYLASESLILDVIDYEIKMTVPSAAFELIKIDAENAKASLAQIKTQFMSKKTVLMSCFNLTEEEADKEIAMKNQDMIDDAMLQAQIQMQMQQIMNPQPVEEVPGLDEIGQEEEIPPEESEEIQTSTPEETVTTQQTESIKFIKNYLKKAKTNATKQSSKNNQDLEELKTELKKDLSKIIDKKTEEMLFKITQQIMQLRKHD